MKKIINWIKEMANKILTLLGLKKKIYATKNSVDESTVSIIQAGTVTVTITDSDGNTVSKKGSQCLTKSDADNSTCNGVTITGPTGKEDKQLVSDVTVAAKAEPAALDVTIKWYPSSNDNLKTLYAASYAEVEAQSSTSSFSGSFSCSGYLDIETTPNIHTTSDPYSIMITNALMESITMSASNVIVQVTLPDSMLNTALELTGRKFNCSATINWQTSNFTTLPSVSYVFQKLGSTVDTVTISGTKYAYVTPIKVNKLSLAI
jgi:hypothetical protein